jgi:hypothetical protein
MINMMKNNKSAKHECTHYPSDSMDRSLIRDELYQPVLFVNLYLKFVRKKTISERGSESFKIGFKTKKSI